MTPAPVLATALTTALREVSETFLLHHTNPWELDEAFVSAGFRTGVCAFWDDEGLEPELKRRPGNTGPVLSRMVSEGRLGRALGVGWFRYPGGGGLVVDPLVEDLLREEARFARISRSELTAADLTACLMPAVIEAVTRIVRKRRLAPAIVDKVSGEMWFRREAGGIFSLADRIGTDAVRAGLELSAKVRPASAGF